MNTATYRVKGMSCDHCVQAIRRELALVDGVRDIGIELDAGLVTISSHEPLDDAAVQAAVEEAGYEVVT